MLISSRLGACPTQFLESLGVPVSVAKDKLSLFECPSAFPESCWWVILSLGRAGSGSRSVLQRFWWNSFNLLFDSHLTLTPIKLGVKCSCPGSWESCLEELCWVARRKPLGWTSVGVWLHSRFQSHLSIAGGILWELWVGSGSSPCTSALFQDLFPTSPWGFFCPQERWGI